MNKNENKKKRSENQRRKIFFKIHAIAKKRNETNEMKNYKRQTKEHIECGSLSLDEWPNEMCAKKHTLSTPTV